MVALYVTLAVVGYVGSFAGASRLLDAAYDRLGSSAPSSDVGRRVAGAAYSAVKFLLAR